MSSKIGIISINHNDHQSPSPDVGIRSLSIGQNASQLVASDSAGAVHVYTLKDTDLNVHNWVFIVGGYQLL